MRSEIGADRWRRIEDILDVALACAPNEWGQVLSESCGGDAELRAEVEALLRQSDKAVGFLDEPPAAAAAVSYTHLTLPTICSV